MKNYLAFIICLLMFTSCQERKMSFPNDDDILFYAARHTTSNFSFSMKNIVSIDTQNFAIEFDTAIIKSKRLDGRFIGTGFDKIILNNESGDDLNVNLFSLGGSIFTQVNGTINARLFIKYGLFSDEGWLILKEYGTKNELQKFFHDLVESVKIQETQQIKFKLCYGNKINDYCELLKNQMQMECYFADGINLNVYKRHKIIIE